MKPKRKKEVSEEDMKEVHEALKKAGYETEKERNDIMNALTNTGFVKKGRLFGLRQLKSPFVIYMRDDGQLEIRENAEPGLLEIDRKDDDPARHVLDPKKIQTMENPLGENDYKLWIVSEGEAFSYPIDVVYDATVFNNIMIQTEANWKEFELGMKSLDIKKWGTIGFIIFLVVAMVMANLETIVHIINAGGATAVNQATGALP